MPPTPPEPGPGPAPAWTTCRWQQAIAGFPRSGDLAPRRVRRRAIDRGCRPHADRHGDAVQSICGSRSAACSCSCLRRVVAVLYSAAGQPPGASWRHDRGHAGQPAGPHLVPGHRGRVRTLVSARRLAAREPRHAPVSPLPATRLVGDTRAITEESAWPRSRSGGGSPGRRAYGFDDIAIVPSRRTRDPEDVDISWEIDAYRFDLPLMASAMDGVVSPATAIEIGRLGGVGVLNLEGRVDPLRGSRTAPRGDRPSGRATRPPPGCSRSTASRSSPS